MPDLSQLFDWSYWTPEKSEIFRSLSLAVSGVVGLVFLIWRAIATDRLSRASLRQANTAISQLQLNIEQVSNAERTANTQLGIMSKNLELSTKTLDSNTEKQLFDRFVSTIASLSNAKDTMERSISIILVGELAKMHVDFLITSSDALWRLAKSVSPAFDLSMESFLTFQPTNELEDKIRYLKALPLAYWIDMKPSFRHTNPFHAIQSMSDKATEICENDKVLVEVFWSYLDSMQPALRQRFWYQAQAHTKNEIQTYIDVMEDIRSKWRWAELKYDRVNLDGFILRKHCHNALMVRATLRGATCINTDFSEAVAVASDFRAALLDGADFSNADLTYSDFSYSRLSGAVFDGADVSGCCFVECHGLEESQLARARNVHEAVIADMWWCKPQHASDGTKNTMPQHDKS